MAIVESPKGERLGITHRGIGVVEHYLMARRLMIRNIYQLPKKLGFENFLVDMLSNLAATLEHNDAYKNLRHKRLGQFLLAANNYKDKSQREKFIADNYPVYKDLCDYDVFAVIRRLADICDENPAAQIATRLHRRIMPKIVRFDFADLKQITAKVNEFKLKHKKDFQDWQIAIIETPASSYNSNADDTIYVVNENGDINPISDYSIMIDAMSDKLEHAPFLSIDKVIADDNRIAALVKSLIVRRPAA
jgi:HD superfamily phosphohydrolase